VTTCSAILPGEQLAEQLEALGMSAAALARQLKVPTNRITHILNGQRAITGIPRCGWGPSSVLVRNSG
jgi:plasmid maintenance system antidote protein VapI